MTKNELMALADAYASEVAETPPHPTPLERALAVTKIEKARAALESALEGVCGDAKPNCTECAKWRKEQADNREWIECVAEGRRIVENLVAKELQCRNS